VAHAGLPVRDAQDLLGTHRSNPQHVMIIQLRLRLVMRAAPMRAAWLGAR
jgi:hypothetical protein